MNCINNKNNKNLNSYHYIINGDRKEIKKNYFVSKQRIHQFIIINLIKLNCKIINKIND